MVYCKKGACKIKLMPTIEEIEFQLQRRIAEYPQTSWGRKQTDSWDKQTNFVYHILNWDVLNKKIEELEKPLANYAINRWFNFWSAVAVEKIFCALPGVTPNINYRDRLVDFSIQGINFDHKTSVFPSRYRHSLDFARHHESHLIIWLYQNQSRQQRYHTANRLFIILYAGDGDHWRLRADITRIKQVIEKYVSGFDLSKLMQLSLGKSKVLSDIIWCMR